MPPPAGVALTVLPVTVAVGGDAHLGPGVAADGLLVTFAVVGLMPPPSPGWLPLTVLLDTSLKLAAMPPPSRELLLTLLVTVAVKAGCRHRPRRCCR